MSLPPVPDAVGCPRPPAAPRIIGPWTGRRRATARHHRADERQSWLGSLDAEPPGYRELRDAHPMLEEVVGAAPTVGVRLGRGAAVTGVVLVQGVLVAGLLLLLRGVTEEAVRDVAVVLWFMAGMALLLGLVVVVFAGQRLRIRASAHVVNAGGPTSLWLYELTAVTIRRRWHGLELRLAGPFVDKTWSLSLPLGLLETNQQLWELVYHGIRHSAVAGAEIDGPTRRLLRLPAGAQAPIRFS